MFAKMKEDKLCLAMHAVLAAAISVTITLLAVKCRKHSCCDSLKKGAKRAFKEIGSKLDV